METLHEGQKIEVLWLITTHRGTARHVWWDATVTRLVSGSRKGARKGEVLYTAGHGHEASPASVIFKDAGFLIETGGAGHKPVPHKWRPAGIIASSSEDVDLPTGLPAVRTLEPASINRDISCVSCAGCTSLIPRIEKLERTVLPSDIVSEGTTALLSVLRSKLGAQLDFPLLTHGDRSSADRGAHRTVQELLRVQADCSLGQLERIADRARQLMPDESQCIPSFAPGVHLRPQTSTFRIVFSTYFALCRFLDIKSSAEVLDSVIAVRRKGKNKTPIATRVLGALFCREADRNLPLVITIGHNLRQHEGFAGPIPVLRRMDTTWDEVDKLYEHELEGTHMLPAEIVKECELDARNADDSDCASVELTQESEVFALKWTRVSKLHARGTFQHGEAMEVHGTLQVTVPYVLFRGAHHGAELAKALTDDFIASAMPK